MSNEDIKIFPWLKDINKNIIHTCFIEEQEEQEGHECFLLRKEISIIHQTYQRELNSLKETIDAKDNQLRSIFNVLLLLEIKNEYLTGDITDLNLKFNLLKKSREDWIGRSLKLHYLFKEMDKVGLKQSEDIFEAYKDIEIPDNEVPIYIKEKYIPTILTNVVVTDPSDEEDAF